MFPKHSTEHPTDLNSTPRKVLFWTHDPASSSTRRRLLPFGEALQGRGWQWEIQTLPTCRLGRRVLERRADLAHADLLVLGNVRLGPGEATLLQKLHRNVVVDVDEPLYLPSPQESPRGPEGFWGQAWRFQRTCAIARGVLAGNAELAAQVGERSHRVQVAPTGVDAQPFTMYTHHRRPADQPPVVVWAGEVDDLPHLDRLRGTWQRLVDRFPGLRLRVVCPQVPDWPSSWVERWPVERREQAIATADVGIWPLTETPRSRATCGLPVLRYLAHGVPCVASPVGALQDIVAHSCWGYLAAHSDAWVQHVETLLTHPERRRRMGREGLGHVQRHYDRTALAARSAAWVEQWSTVDGIHGAAHGSERERRPSGLGVTEPRQTLLHASMES